MKHFLLTYAHYSCAKNASAPLKQVIKNVELARVDISGVVFQEMQEIQNIGLINFMEKNVWGTGISNQLENMLKREMRSFTD